MTDQKSELELSAEKITNLPTSEAVVKFLSDIIGDTDGSGGICRITVTPENLDMYAVRNVTGARFFDDHTLLNIRQRYDIMVSLLAIMVDAGFKILKLEFAVNSGLAGTRIKFESPKGRQFEHNYFCDMGEDGDRNKGFCLIPDDFLHELKMFPSRHG